MKAAFFAISATLLAPLAAWAQSTPPSPYVETTTLTFYWGFTNSYISNADGDAPTLPDLATLDPDDLPTGHQLYTDTLTARAYTGPTAGFFPPAGANQEIIQLLLQRLVREQRLDKKRLEDRWQLIAVREAPSTVAELAGNQYRVFLAGQRKRSSVAYTLEVAPYGPESVEDDPAPEEIIFSYDGVDGVTVDTGLTITLGASSGNYTETNWGPANNKVKNASGNVTTAFTVNFGAVFYEDPKHEVDEPENDPEFNYHLTRNVWTATATGFINYNIRSTPAPFATFVATNSKATATGWFYHQHNEYEYKDETLVEVEGEDSNYSTAGIAPLRVTMSTIQYQKRDRFRSL